MTTTEPLTSPGDDLARIAEANSEAYGSILNLYRFDTEDDRARAKEAMAIRDFRLSLRSPIAPSREEEVERVAKALCNVDWGDKRWSRLDADSELRRFYRTRAEVAVAALTPLRSPIAPSREEEVEITQWDIDIANRAIEMSLAEGSPGYVVLAAMLARKALTSTPASREEEVERVALALLNHYRAAYKLAPMQWHEFCEMDQNGGLDDARAAIAALTPSGESLAEYERGVNCPDCGGRIATACPHCGAQPCDMGDFAALTPSGESLAEYERGREQGLKEAARVASEWMSNSMLAGDCATQDAQETGRKIATAIESLLHPKGHGGEA